MGFIKKIILLAVLAAIGIGFHLGFLLAMPEYHNRTFQSSVGDIMRFNLKNEADLEKRLRESAERNNIPLTEEGLFIYSEQAGSYTAKIKYQVIVDYYGYYQKTFDYEIEVSK